MIFVLEVYIHVIYEKQVYSWILIYFFLYIFVILCLIFVFVTFDYDENINELAHREKKGLFDLVNI